MTQPTPPPLTDPPATLLPALSHLDLIAGGDALVRCLVLVLDAKVFELLPELVGAFGAGLALWSHAAAHHLLEAPGSSERLRCVEICHLSPAPISSEKPGCLAPPLSAARKDPTTGGDRRV